MSQFEIVMPKMGESITEATITKWFKKENDPIEEDEVLLEIATDKVDSEIPSPVAGIISKILYKEGDVVPVGKKIAIITLATGNTEEKSNPTIEKTALPIVEAKENENSPKINITSSQERFYSPLVKTIAKKENLSQQELDSLPGSGRDGRVNKDDILKYVSEKKATPANIPLSTSVIPQSTASSEKSKISAGEGDQVIEMDRIRKVIADHMIHSKHTAAHVTNFVEADVTNLVLWRNKVKDDFLKREKVNLTYMPVFIEAVVNALKEYPQINSSVNGYEIIMRKNINLGIAVALPSGNLIVPVIKNTDHLNLLGITKELNRLAELARNNKLSPDDIQGGTFTISNFGSFKNSFGTPIINQPQVAILATGSIEKKPAVVETPVGDVIAIRHKMFLSLTYDHRIIDGAIGGAFLRKIADYLEGFDSNKQL